MNKNAQDLAKRLKATYPDYASVPDEELVAKVTAKYPVYADYINQAESETDATGAINISSPQPVSSEMPSAAPPVTSAPSTPPAMRKSGQISAREVDELLNSEHGEKIRRFFGAVKKLEGGQPDLIVGGQKRFDPSKDHPNVVGLVTKQGKSTAAGDFQITGTNWYGKKGKSEGLKQRLGAKDFSPEQQLRAAIMLFADRDNRAGLNALLSGDYDTAERIAAKDWAALPSSQLHPKKFDAKKKQKFLEMVQNGDVPTTATTPRSEPTFIGDVQQLDVNVGGAEALTFATPENLEKLGLFPKIKNKPLPEPNSAITAQIESATMPDSPRAGVLFTEPAHLANLTPEAAANFTPVQTENGLLVVNNEKALQQFGLKTAEEIQTFIKINGIAPLIGKVENVSDTSKGISVVTLDKEGRELSSSVVTTPENAIAQMRADKAAFGDRVGQQVSMPVAEALKKRKADLDAEKFPKELKLQDGRTIFKAADQTDDKPTTPKRYVDDKGTVLIVSPDGKITGERFPKEVVLTDGKKLIKSAEQTDNKDDAPKIYLDEQGTKYTVSPDGKITEENPPKQPFSLSGKDGKTYIESGSQEGLKPNQKRVRDTTLSKGGVFIAEKVTGKNGKESYQLIDPAQPAQQPEKVNRISVEAKQFSRKEPVNEITVDPLTKGGTINADPNAENDPNADVVDTDFKERVTFQNKPKNVSNREWLIENLIPKIANRLKIDAIDVQKVLEKGIKHEKGTRLEDLTKDQFYDFVMTNDLYEDMVRQGENKRDALARIISSGRELSAEDRQRIGTNFGISDKEIEDAQKGKGDWRYKDAAAQGEKTRAIYETFLKDYRKKADEKGESQANAQFRAMADAGWLDKEKAEKLISEENSAFEKWKAGAIAQAESDARTSTALGASKGATSVDDVNKRIKEITDRRLEEIPKNIINTYGSFKNYFDEAARIEKEYKFRPLAAPLEAAKGFVSAVPEAASAVLKFVDIIREVVPTNPLDIMRFLDNNPFKATEGNATKVAHYIDSLQEKYIPKNPDLQDYYTLGNVVGQMAVQLGTGVISGGAKLPVLLGSALGSSEQYEEATKGGATDLERKGAAILGAVLATSDAVPLMKFLAPLSKSQKLGFLNRYLNSIFTNATKEVGEKQAQAIVGGSFRQLINSAIQTGKKLGTGTGLEGLQESLEGKGNDLYASLTYDKKRKVFVLSDEDIVEFLYGSIGGTAGSVGQIVLEKHVQSPQSSAVPIEEMRDFPQPDSMPDFLNQPQRPDFLDQPDAAVKKPDLSKPLPKTPVPQRPKFLDQPQRPDILTEKPEFARPSVGDRIETFIKGQPKIGTVREVKEKTGKENNTLVVDFDDGSRSFVPERKATVRGIASDLFGKAPETNVQEPAPDVQAETVTPTESTIEDVQATEAAHDAATSPLNDLPEPTDAQREAGNYKMGHIDVGGLAITVEIPKGGIRSGVDKNGKSWSRTMESHYGYIKRTVGADKENIDVFVKDETPQDFSGNVFIVDQIRPDTGKFDEHKILIGFSNEQEAKDAYLSNYAKDWKGLGKITGMSFDEFKKWANSEPSKPIGETAEISKTGVPAPTSQTGDFPKSAVTPSGTRINYRGKVIDESDILTSFDEGFPREALQPRNTDRKASREKIVNNAANLDVSLMDDSPVAGDGAPKVYPVEIDGKTKYIAVTRNHGVESIREAIRTYPEKAAEYQKFAKSKDASATAQNPVYVHELDVATAGDLAKFAIDANVGAQRKMSDAEQAETDARLITAGLMERFIPADDGSIHSRANADFIKNFLKTVVDRNEHGAMQTESGELSQTGVRRIKNAIFAFAFGHTKAGLDALARMAESTNDNVKNITNALLATSGAFADLRQAIKDGKRFKNLDITSDIAKAAQKFSEIKADSAQSVDLYLQQDALFGRETTPFQDRILQMFDKYSRSAKAIRTIFNNYIDAANAIGDPAQRDIFGQTPKADAVDTFAAAVELYEEKNGTQIAEGLFAGTEPEKRGENQTSDAEVSSAEESKAEQIRRQIENVDRMLSQATNARQRQALTQQKMGYISALNKLEKPAPEPEAVETSPEIEIPVFPSTLGDSPVYDRIFSEADKKLKKALEKYEKGSDKYIVAVEEYTEEIRRGETLEAKSKDDSSIELSFGVRDYADEVKSGYFDDVKSVAETIGGVVPEDFRKYLSKSVLSLSQKLMLKAGKVPSDLLRTTIIIPRGDLNQSTALGYKVIEEMGKLGYRVWTDTKGEPDLTNRFEDAAAGYKDINIKFIKGENDPIIRELQLIQPEMMNAKVVGHKDYDDQKKLKDRLINDKSLSDERKQQIKTKIEQLDEKMAAAYLLAFEADTDARATSTIPRPTSTIAPNPSLSPNVGKFVKNFSTDSARVILETYISTSRLSSSERAAKFLSASSDVILSGIDTTSEDIITDSPLKETTNAAEISKNKKPLSKTEVEKIIQNSPTPDFDNYLREVVGDFKHLVSSTKREETITPQELAGRLANNFDLNTPKNFIAYSVLMNADEKLQITGSQQGVYVRGRHKGNDKKVEITGDNPALKRVEGENRNEKFKKWFGNSKVVDKNGNPLVVYHGTQANFDAFDLNKLGSATMHPSTRWGIVTTPNKEYAGKSYASGGGGNVMPLYVSVQKPYMMTNEEYRQLIPQGRNSSAKAAWDFIENLKAKNENDGIILLDRNGEISEIFAFNPNQLKSVFNSGEFSFENDSILKRAEKEYSNTEFHNIKFVPALELIEKATIENTGSLLKFNLEAQEFLRRVKEEIDIRAGNKTIGEETVEMSSSGEFFDEFQTEQIVKTLREIGKEQSENIEIANFFNNFADKMENAAKNGKGTIVAYMYDRILPHELFHQASYLLSLAKNLTARHARSEELKNHPAFEKASDFLLGFAEYRALQKTSPETFDAVVIEETGAYIEGGERELLGIPVEAAANYMNLFYDSFVEQNAVRDKNGEIQPEAAQKALELFEKIEGESNEQIKRVIESYRERENARSLSGKSGEIAGRTSESDGRSPESDGRKEEVTENRRKAAFSRILGEDVFYEPQSHKETEKRAESLEKEKGVAQAVSDALTADKPSAESMRVVYRELARLNDLADSHLASGNKLKYEAVAGELAKLTTAIVNRQVALGQAVEIAKTLAPLSPEHTLIVAARLKQQAQNDDSAELTQKETEKIRETAKENTDLSKKLTRSENAIVKLKEKIKELQKGTRVLQPRKIGESKPRPISQIEKKIQAELTKDFDKYAADLKQLFAVTNQIEIAPTLKRAENEPLTANQQEVLTAIGAKILFEGLQTRDNYGIEAFRTEMIGLAGSPVAPYIDEIHAQSLEKIQEIKKEAQLLRLAERIKTANTKLSETEAKAEAQKIIDNRKAKAKEKAQILGEHTKAKSAFNRNKELTENIAFYDNSAEVVFAGILLKTGKSNSINSVVGEVAREFDLSLEKARDYAGKAKNILEKIKAEQTRQRQELSGQTEEEIKNAAELRRNQIRARMRLNKFLSEISTPKNLLQRFNNDFRAKLVLNYGTQIFNAVQAVVGAIPQEVFTDLVDTAMRKAGRLAGKTNALDEISPEIKFKDAFLPVAYIFANNKQMAENVLSEFPDEYFRLFSSILGDVEVEGNVIERGSNAVSKIAHKGFDKSDKLNDWLAKITLAKAQEAHFRTAVVIASITAQLRAHGKELKELLASGEVNTIRPEIIKAAVDKALRVTFAEDMGGDPLGKQLKALYEFTDKFLPVVVNPVVFARFTYTVAKSVTNAHTFGLMDSKTFGGEGYTTRSFAKGIYGMTAMALTYGLLALFNNDDDEWFQWRLFGKNEPPVDIRRFYPVSAYAFTASLIKNKIEGRPLPPLSDFIEGYASLDLDQYGRSAGMEEVKAIWNFLSSNDIEGGEKLGKSSARFTGSTLGGMLRFFKPFRDIFAEIDSEEKKYREHDDTAQGIFVNELSRNLPIARLLNYPVKKNPVTGEDVEQIHPAGRIIGLNFINPMFTNPKLTVAEEHARNLFPIEFKGKEMTKSEREAATIRRELKQAVRRGEITAKDVEPKIKEFIAAGKLTEKSAGLLRKSLQLTDLQEIISKNYSPNDEKDVKKLEWLQSKMTDKEKQGIAPILKKKEENAAKQREAELNPKDLAEKLKRANTDKAVELFEEYRDMLNETQKREFVAKIKQKADNAAKSGTLTDQERENILSVLPDYQSRFKPRRPSKPKKVNSSLSSVY